MWRVTESAGLNERDGTYLRPQSSDSDEGRPGMRADDRDRRPDPRGPMRPDRAAEAGPQRMHDMLDAAVTAAFISHRPCRSNRILDLVYIK